MESANKLDCFNYAPKSVWNYREYQFAPFMLQIRGIKSIFLLPWGFFSLYDKLCKVSLGRFLCIETCSTLCVPPADCLLMVKTVSSEAILLLDCSILHLTLVPEKQQGLEFLRLAKQGQMLLSYPNLSLCVCQEKGLTSSLNCSTQCQKEVFANFFYTVVTRGLLDTCRMVW